MSMSYEKKKEKKGRKEKGKNSSQVKTMTLFEA